MEKYRKRWRCTAKVREYSPRSHTFDADETRHFIVLQELRNELAPVNERCMLRDGHTPNRGPDELDSSTRGVKHRGVEQARRTAIRHLHEQMSVYFSVPSQRKMSARDLLLFSKFTNSTSEPTSYLPIYHSRHLSKDWPTCLPRTCPPPSFGNRTAGLGSCPAHNIFIRTRVVVIQTRDAS